MKPADVGQKIPCGPDPQVHAEAIRKFVQAGFDHVAIVGIGPDQDSFIRFFEKELRPLLG